MKINIFTYGSGYETKVYERFLGSLFDSGFDGKLYCFIEDKDISAIQKISKELFSLVNWVQYNSKNEMLNAHYRFFIYNDFVYKIDLSLDEYTFFCDFRDVLFQKNICEYRLDKNVDMFLFREDQIIKNCPHNSGWLIPVKNSFPDYRYDYEKEHIICVGTILTKNTIVKQFLNIFCSTMLVDDLCKKDTFVEQGIHNFLYYNNLYPFKTKILTNEDNLVNTLCYGYHKINDHNQITNYINNISYVAHQYDRMNVELKQKLSVKYDFVSW